MNFKLDNDYAVVLNKAVKNKKLADEITQNLNFVEKYLDKVDVSFEKEIDKAIAYKQLGVIAFSCVEALWKGIIMTINGNCASRDCKKECKYRQYATEELNRLSPDGALKHLNNMRILCVLPFEQEGIEDLQHLRNHIHLTRAAINSDKVNKFDIKFVEDMLRLYYVTLNQIVSMLDFYFDKESPCLYELDEYGYEETQKMTIKEIQSYNTYKILNSCMSLFYKKQLLFRKDSERLKKLKNEKNIDVDGFVTFLGRLLYYEGAHFKTEDDYEKALAELFEILKSYLSKSSNIIERIKEVMEKNRKFNNAG